MLSPEFLKCVDDLVRDSVVLIKAGGKPVATGFFVSEAGDICTCHHFAVTPGARTLTVAWQGIDYPVQYRGEFSVSTRDFAILSLPEETLRGRSIKPLPVLTRTVTSGEDFDSLIVAGFAGTTDSYAPPRVRLFAGTLLGIEDHALHNAQGFVPKLEIADLVVGWGISGAPIFNARLFRVIGYIHGRFEDVHERLGKAWTLSELLLRRADLLPQWDSAALNADRVKLDFLQTAPAGFADSLLTPENVLSLAAEHSQRSIASLARAGIYNERLFVDRSVGGLVDQFLSASEYPLAVVSGASGTGKTNLLANVAVSLSKTQTPVIFISCGTFTGEHPLKDLGSILGVPASLSVLLSLLERATDAKPLIILDGFHEWSKASGSTFRGMLAVVDSLVGSAHSRFKIIISSRTEFLRQEVRELLDRSLPPGDLPLRIIFQYAAFESAGGEDEVTRATIEIPPLSPDSDQAALYEHYRSVGQIQDASGRIVGIRPNTSYTSLPAQVRRFLDRPLFLKLFMVKYHGRDVPDFALRSRFLAEIVTPDLLGWAPSSFNWERAQVLLSYLANMLLNQGESTCSGFLLANEPWYDREIVRLLLAHTFILSQTEDRQSVASRFGFSSDWLMEYFLAIFLRESCHSVRGVPKRSAILNQRMTMDQTELPGEPIVGALTLFAEWALTHDRDSLAAILNAASLPDDRRIRYRVVEAFFEAVRTQFSFQHPIETAFDRPIASFCVLLAEMRGWLQPSGLSRILQYVDEMGDDALRDSLDLLTGDENLWGQLQPPQQSDLISIRALKRFKFHKIPEALNECEGLDFNELSGDTLSRSAFVMGRCLQFQRRYAEALRMFVCVGDSGHYGSMCRHQIGFIRFFQHSDYRGAAQILSAACVSTDGDKWNNSASRLLYATCLIELGDYETALASLEDEADRRRKNRQHVGYGKVLRSIAQAHFRRFDAATAIEKVDLALQETKAAAHYLTYAGALEIKASIAGLLAGEIPLALQLLDEALALNERAKYNPGYTWAIQTRAFICSIAGDTDAVERDLAVVESLKGNPNQVRRSRLIRLLSSWRGSGQISSEEIAAAQALKSDYESIGQGWYPGILSLLLAAAQHQPVDGAFKDSISPIGLTRSFLYRSIARSEEM